MFDLYLIDPATNAVVESQLVVVDDRAEALAVARSWGWPVSRTRARRSRRG
jgi:hypothetical protein